MSGNLNVLMLLYITFILLLFVLIVVGTITGNIYLTAIPLTILMFTLAVVLLYLLINILSI